MSAIGVFDSGVGGFTVLKAIQAKLPGTPIIYLADQANIPYSQKSSKWLITRSRQITQFLHNQGCTTIVIACNTATVSAIADLRRDFPGLAFVGVEPAIKPAAQKTKTGTILVLATAQTLQSQRLKELCGQYADGKAVLYQDMPEWVTLAESGDIDSADTQAKIRNSLAPFQNRSVESVVLACTHYPFFLPIIKKAFPRAVIFEPSRAVADRVSQIHQTSAADQPGLTLATTGNLAEFKAAAANLLPLPVKINSLPADLYQITV